MKEYMRERVRCAPDEQNNTEPHDADVIDLAACRERAFARMNAASESVHPLRSVPIDVRISECTALRKQLFPERKNGGSQ